MLRPRSFRTLNLRALRSPRGRIGAGLVAVAIVAATVVAVGLTAGRGGSPMIDVSSAGCGAGWKAPSAGPTTFRIDNRSATTADVALTDGGSTVFAEIPTLGPGVIRPLRVTLEPGRYSWKCVSVNGAFTISSVERVGGSRVGDPSPGYEPVTPDDLTAAALTYRASASKGLTVLAHDTDILQRAVDSGDRAGAEHDWLVAHLDYERLGAVYDTFGDFNGEINGRADGLIGGVTSPRFTGFLRLEYALWHHQSPATLTKVAGVLDRDVHALVRAFPSQLLPVTDVALRAHEIIENALQFELTGDTDEGSHTNLATVRANIDGDRTVLAALRALVEAREPKLLARAEAQLATFANLLDRYRSPDGRWTPVESLDQAQHERLDADADAALATLDQMPAVLEQASGDSS